MEISPEQFSQIEPYLPRQRGNVLHQNLDIINAILWLAENDCKWAALPARFGSWHTVYTRVNRWSKAGILDRVFEQMQRLQLIRLRLEVMPVDGSTNGSAAAPLTEAERSWSKARRAPSMDLTSELPKFAWVPRIRVCHRRLLAAQRREARRDRKVRVLTPATAATVMQSTGG